MTAMFGGARWRMVGWSILVLSLILIAISAVVYVSANRMLMSTVDAQLKAASESARAELVETGGIGDLQREGYQAGLLYVVVSADGSVIYNPQQVDVRVLPPDLLANRSAAFDTAEISGSAVRLYRQQISGPGGDSMTLVVGVTLAPEQTAA
jgi:hypothetical protein